MEPSDFFHTVALKTHRKALCKTMSDRIKKITDEREYVLCETEQVNKIMLH